MNDIEKAGDVISREALKAYARKVICGDNPTNTLIIRMFDEIIDNAPSQWIPITFREADDDEYKEFLKRYDDIPREECKVYDCRMPDDGQEVLVTTCGGYVCEDIFCADPDAYGFESCSDPGDAIAWMPKPEPYKKEGTENG